VRVDGIGSESYPLVVFKVSYVESLNSASRWLVNLDLKLYVNCL
jgi:hypothetical protein